MTLLKRVQSHGLVPFFATSIIAGIILAILAPYHTSQFAFSHRLVFWVALCIAGGMGAAIGDRLSAKYRQRRPAWLQILAQSLGATATVFACFWLYHVVVAGVPTGLFYVVVPFYIWIVGVIISTVGVLADRKVVSDTGAPARATIIERLKPTLRSADIYALSSEDHYVRVHTSQGDDLILMRLSDAVKEVTPLAGLMTHRSWWVAEQGVESVKKLDGKMKVTLKNGLMAPVSRARAKDVRTAGWT